MSVIRTAVPADVPVILTMIHDLAVYEREPDAVKTTPGTMLHDSLFGANRGSSHTSPRTAAACRVSHCGS